MNVKQVYGEWYDTVSENWQCLHFKRNHWSVKGRAKCDIFNIDDVELIINDLCVN